MATTTTTTSNSSSKATTIGYIVQLCGVGGFTLGAILSFHHIAAGASFIGGAAAFYIGGKIRSLA